MGMGLGHAGWSLVACLVAPADPPGSGVLARTEPIGHHVLPIIAWGPVAAAFSVERQRQASGAADDSHPGPLIDGWGFSVSRPAHAGLRGTPGRSGTVIGRTGTIGWVCTGSRRW